MKRIASIVQNHFVNDNRVWRTADTLQRAGNEVVVVCILKEGLPEREVKDGVKVHRIRIRSSKLPSGKIFGLIKFIEMYARIILGYRKWDAWHCNDFNPFYMGVIARAFRPKLKLVYDSHEYQRERIDKSAFQKKVIRRIERRHIHKASAVITVSESIAQEYQRLYSLQEVKVIRNVPHASEITESDVLRRELGISDDQVLFLYQGKIGHARGVEPLLEAFSKVDDLRAVLVVMGDGEYRPLAEEYASKYSQIFYRQPVDYKELIRYSASADWGIVSSQNVCLNNWFSLPNKLFEYIQALVPVFTNNLVECEKMVNERQIGVVVQGWTPASIVEAVGEALKREKGQYRDALLQARGELTWENEEKLLLEIYNEL